MIVTFYSYKGGVGRSMALANIADQLARSGMRVLMVDFDLEAPGLEHFFPIEHERVRGREGLLDLLLAFKYAMSVASSGTDEGEEDAYRDLDRYISTIYPPRSDGGCLDLIPAGLRLSDDQIARYGAELRRFDWQDFYYVWSGELFFEWFRRTCADRYDIVLVDSRTGVTELGGVCAYQLADVIVALCAPNLQNLEGTAWMVRHFLSPQVKAVRDDRPLEVLVVPARVDQQDSELLELFAERFEDTFGRFTPDALEQAHLSFWDLQVPYVPAYAFEEQVITDPGRAEERRALVRAYDSLRNAIALLAPERNAVAALRAEAAGGGRGAGGVEPVETRYDPTTRFSSPDVFVSYSVTDQEAADQIRELLGGRGRLRVAETAMGERWDIPGAKVSLFLVGSTGRLSDWQQTQVDVLTATSETRLLPVLLPGSDILPEVLRSYTFLDLRGGLDEDRLLEAVRAGLQQSIRKTKPSRYDDPIPYPGFSPFSEADAPLFFGRDVLVHKVLTTLDQRGTCAVIGDSASGKTSLVNAGVLPALRAGALSGSELWPIVHVDDDGRVPAVEEALRSLTSLPRRSRKVVVVFDPPEWMSDNARDAALRELIDTPDPVVLPLVVLRSDRAASLPSHHCVELTPMSSDELRQTVESPARAVGLHLEPGLADRLLNDVGDEPGALPFLQFTLRNLWLRRRDGYLTHQAYVETGGLKESLAVTAEGWFDSIDSSGKRQARELLLRLVTAGSDGMPQRRAVPMTAIAAMGAADICEQLLVYRLLVTSYDTPTTRVQLAHSAFVFAWPRFFEWYAEAGSVLDLRWRLSEAAEDWRDSGHASKELLDAWSLNAVEETPIREKLTLTDLEQSYLAASQTDIRRKRWMRMLSYILVIAAAFGFPRVIDGTSIDGAIWPPVLAGFVAAAVVSLVRWLSNRRERRFLTP